jgi:intracellular sulfur oxidation DsrE/DsrF family protein
MEQCGIAAKNQGAKPEGLLPGIKVVGNGWISLAAYQAKGFAYISP